LVDGRRMLDALLKPCLGHVGVHLIQQDCR
jgi:hypothetical protein